jgi:hypothetical protein
VNPSFDLTREPMDLLPLRPWEVKKVRAQLAELQSEPPPLTRESRAVLENVAEGYRAALAEYEATTWLARLRRTDPRRLEAIRTYRSRRVGGVRAVPKKGG